MMPFLKPKQAAAPSTIIHKSLGRPEESPEDQDSGLIACAHDLIAAINSKDSRAVASVIRAAFQILDSEPHQEGPHTNDYDSMNELAGRK